MLDAPAARIEQKQLIRKLADKYAVSAKSLDAVFAAGAGVTDQERRYLDDIKVSEAEMLPMQDAVIAARRAGDVERARSILLTDAAPAFRQWLARINTLSDLDEAKNNLVGGQASDAARSFRYLMLQLFAVALLLGAAIAYFALSTIRPLRRLEADIRALSEGGKQGEIVDMQRSDEVGAIARALQAFRQATVVRSEADAAASAEQEMIVDALVGAL